MRRPRFIAEQARDARGLLGRLVAFIMALETWSENQRAMAALEVRDGDHVLDIGCGHGRSLAALAARTPSGRVVGADPSELMAEIAIQRNRGLVRSGRVDIAVAAVEDLAFGGATFDKALCVHVIYFWNDLDISLREIARVLKPGGRLALLFRTEADAAASSFPAEVYRFLPLEHVLSGLMAAGFELETVDRSREPVLVTARATRPTTKGSLSAPLSASSLK